MVIDLNKGVDGQAMSEAKQQFFLLQWLLTIPDQVPKDIRRYIVYWKVFYFLGAIIHSPHGHDRAASEVSQCRTTADGMRTARAFAKCLKLKRFGHVGRDGQPFFFIILKGVDREGARTSERA